MVGVVVVNYKSEKRTLRFVTEELSKISIDFKIAIVNNSANEESNKALLSLKDSVLIGSGGNINKLTDKKKIFIIQSSDNLGFAKANNLGASILFNAYKPNHILFTNNDIIFIDSNIVERLLEKLNTLKNVALIGPNVIGLDGKRQSPEPYIPFIKRYIFMFWLTPFIRKETKIKMFKLNYSEVAEEGTHYKIMGSFFLMKTYDFFKCGMMDQNTFLYAEEVILPERLAKIGKKCYFYPNVSVIHEHEQTTKNHLNTLTKSKEVYKSESYYYRTYKNTPQLLILLGQLSFCFYNKLKSFLK